MKNIILSILMLVLSANTYAEDFLDGMVYDVRLGYNIGGTAPIGMPAEIRKLNSYTLQPNVALLSNQHNKSNWSMTSSSLLYCSPVIFLGELVFNKIQILSLI